MMREQIGLAVPTSAPRTVDRLTTAETIAQWSFLLLFPGFFLYHYAISQQWIPAFAGGLFGAASALVALVAVAFAPAVLTRRITHGFGVSAGVAILLAYVTVWTVVQRMLLGGTEEAAGAFSESATAIVLWIAMLFVGGFYPFARRSTRTGLAIGCALIVAFLIHAFVHYESLLGPFLAFRGSSDEGPDGSKYQGAGRSILVVTLFLGAILQRTAWRIFTLLLGVLAILSIGARAELFSLVLLAGLTIGLAVLRERNWLQLVVVALLVAVVGRQLAPYLENNRATEIADLGSSSSWQARQVLTEDALAVISAHPLVGDHSHRFRSMSAGGYSHNALSAWVSYGAIGFFLYVGSIVGCTLITTRRVLGHNDVEPAWLAAWFLNWVALLLAATAVPVFHPLAALAWGVTLNALAGDATDSYLAERPNPPRCDKCAA